MKAESVDIDGIVMSLNMDFAQELAKKGSNEFKAYFKAIKTFDATMFNEAAIDKKIAKLYKYCGGK